MLRGGFSIAFLWCGIGGTLFFRSADADTPPVTASSALEEIVVTAQKRTENLEQTPISITAITGDTLLQQGVTDIESVMQQTPGVSFKSFGPGQTEIEMRGLESEGGNSPTVGFYLDETSLTPPTGSSNGKVVIDPNLFDLQRVEILRGPQGTLYGAGSMGGTVRLITNPPDLTEFSAKTQESVSRTEGGGWNHAENAALNVALVPDILAIRLVVSNSYDDGWISRIVENPFPLETNPNPACGAFYGCTRGNVLAGHVTAVYPNVNDVDRTSARVAVLYKPVDGLSIDLTWLNQKMASGGWSLFDTVPGTDAHYQPINFPERVDDDVTLFSLLLKYQLQDFEITSATARWYRTEPQIQDESEDSQDAFGIPAFYPPTGAGLATMDETEYTSQVSEELRVATTGTGPLSGLLGGYMSSFKSNTYISWLSPGFQPLFGTGLITYYFSPTHIDQHAVFSEGSYEFTPQLKLTAGLRYFSYNSTFAATQNGLANGGPILSTSRAAASDKGFNPKLNLSFEPNDDTLLYATVAKGYRPGGGNYALDTSGPTSCGPALASIGLTQAPLAFKPDILWSYELGNKLQFFDHTLTINSAIYYESWQGVQQLVALSCGQVFTTNAGNAAVYGGELEIAARPIPPLTLTLSGGYTHAALVANTPTTGGVAGVQLPNVPRATISESVEYKFPLNGNYVIDTRLNDDYVGPRSDVLGPLPSYSLAKLRAGLLGDRLSTFFYINNLGNKMVYLSNDVSLAVNLPSFNRAATEMPRTFGVDFSYKWGNSPR